MLRLKVIARLCRGFSEVEKAWSARIPKENEETIFDKIINKQIPASIVYEDDLVLAFRDISPQAPVHIILIPKKRSGLINLSHAQDGHKSLLGHLLLKASEIAKQENLQDGWRLVSNSGANSCQSIYHLHFHILGGRQLGWPPG